MLLRRRPGESSAFRGAATSPPKGDARTARWLRPGDFVLEVQANTREQFLHAASDVIARFSGLASERIYDALWQREQADSTAIGQGFAIPHARVPGIAAPVTAYLRTATPLDFRAADGDAVRHFLVILVPVDGDADAHLQLLALVARLFSDRRFRKQLAAANTPALAEGAFTTGIARVRVV